MVRRSSIPSPRCADTGSTSTSASTEISSSARISASTAVSRSGATLSILVSDGDATRDAEQIEDGEVLARLRHDAVVGGDDEHHEIDAAGAGQHRAHQLLVARHVDEAERVAVRVALVGEAEVDGDAALLLLRQPVGIDAGQRLD